MTDPALVPVNQRVEHLIMSQLIIALLYYYLRAVEPLSIHSFSSWASALVRARAAARS